MHSMLIVLAVGGVLQQPATSASADTLALPGVVQAEVPAQAPATGPVGPVMPPVFPTAELAWPDPDTVGGKRPMAREYSDGYYTRLDIHRYASYATLPLFVTEYYLGQKLFSADSGTSNDGLRSAHSAVAYGIAGLFAVNTVTGVWNLWVARKDPEMRTRRYVHSILMIVADAGFVATGASAPGNPEHRDGTPNPDYTDEKNRHRTIAIASMSTALAGYLMMLIWK